MQLAERMSRIGIESAFDVLVRARALEAQGRSVIHLEIGEPDFPTPPHVVEAAKQALDEGWTHYGPTQGQPELREAIAAHISRTRGISVGPQHVSVVPGGKPVIFFPMLALLEPGDEVIYPDPGFPIYESMIRFTGATPVPLPLEESRGFSFDLNRFEHLLTDRTKMVVLNSPQNPTGGVIPREDLKAIAELLRERDVIVLSDMLVYEPDIHLLWTALGRLLAPGGSVVIRSQNKWLLIRLWQRWYRATRPRGRQRLQDRIRAFNPEHIYVIRSSYLKRRLEDLGLRHVRVLPSPQLAAPGTRLLTSLYFAFASAVNRLSRGAVALTPSIVVVGTERRRQIEIRVRGEPRVVR